MHATKHENAPLALQDWIKCRNQVLAAFGKFSMNTSESSSAGTKFFVSFRGKTYPPKVIRSILQRRAVNTFSGGSATNALFRNLGFDVVKGIHKITEYQGLKNQPPIRPSTDDLDHYANELFKTRWADLRKSLALGCISSYPGVYMLAYTKQPLSGKRVEVEDIFYIGMSTSSLRARLTQFWKGIDNGSLHSGAMRFYRTWAGRRSFRELHTSNQFYVATLAIPCEPRKGIRSPLDLRKLGTVAALEYFALARVKLALDLEPPLNRK